MDFEPSRMNKGKNTIMDLTTSRYVLCKKSKKNIDSSILSIRSLSNPLPSAFVPSAQASLVPISSDVDLLNTRQGNISTDVSSSFMAFVGGSSRFMFFSPTTINKGKNTIMDLTTRQDNTNTNVSSGFMVFVDGSSGFMSISLTKVGNRPICSLNFDNTEKTIMSAFFGEDPQL
ncbi:hypothetical protein POTOM_046826 [Populus tomentosa]|uniref:Uncharacterized protein n=1 Tax=Populus tomentosa TaxID=118781 RepID=A0A8X7YBK3_POPTO|nr:hypothetical protein POTOM_046826 [Populus tomentosa]